MQIGQSRLARLMVALCVVLSLAFMPILSQQAMSAHHASDALAAVAPMVHSHVIKSAEPCEKTKVDKEGKNCCDISCSTVATFEVGIVPVFGVHRADYDQVEADQLLSRITLGLKRPPRV